MGRPRTCDCGACKKCKGREAQARWIATKTEEERREIVARRDMEKVRARDQERYLRDREKRLDAAAIYRRTHREAALENAKRWRLLNPGRENEAKQRWLERNREKHRAHYTAQNALRAGRLTAGECVHAADGTCYGQMEMHHEDYSKPLEVTWLCRRHHAKRHRKRLVEIA